MGSSSSATTRLCSGAVLSGCGSSSCLLLTAPLLLTDSLMMLLRPSPGGGGASSWRASVVSPSTLGVSSSSSMALTSTLGSSSTASVVPTFLCAWRSRSSTKRSLVVPRGSPLVSSSTARLLMRNTTMARRAPIPSAITTPLPKVRLLPDRPRMFLPPPSCPFFDALYLHEKGRSPDKDPAPVWLILATVTPTYDYNVPLSSNPRKKGEV